MNVEMLLLLLFVFLTIVAYMIAMNARGIWRMTLSFLLATCMLGGTVWVIILQHSTTAKDAMVAERRRMEAEKREMREALLEQTEQMSNAGRVSHLIAQANIFAVMLQRERLQDSEMSHDQLIGRATATGERVEALQGEINSYRQVFEKFPESAKHLEEAMAELREACRLYRAYYFAESDMAERRTEQQMRQRAKNAQDILDSALAAVGGGND